jgi:hypothetical protein
MKRHLNEQEVLEWVSGTRTPAGEEHVTACAECRNEVERLSAALAGFRTTTREWAEQERQAAAVRVGNRSRRFGWQSLRLAAALAVLLVCFGVLLTRHNKVQPVDPGNADDAVLERVDAAMSREVPSAMEPLSQLVPTERNEKAGAAN